MTRPIINTLFSWQVFGDCHDTKGHVDNPIRRLAAVKRGVCQVSLSRAEQCWKSLRPTSRFCTQKVRKVLPFFDCLTEVRQMEADNMTGALILVD